MKSRGLWEEVPVEEAWDRKGRGSVSVRWVDTNKGGGRGSSGKEPSGG